MDLGYFILVHKEVVKLVVEPLLRNLHWNYLLLEDYLHLGLEAANCLVVNEKSEDHGDE